MPWYGLYTRLIMPVSFRLKCTKYTFFSMGLLVRWILENRGINNQHDRKIVCRDGMRKRTTEQSTYYPPTSPTADCYQGINNVWCTSNFPFLPLPQWSQTEKSSFSQSVAFVQCRILSCDEVCLTCKVRTFYRASGYTYMSMGYLSSDFCRWKQNLLPSCSLRCLYSATAFFGSERRLQKQSIHNCVIPPNSLTTWRCAWPPGALLYPR